MPSLIRRAGLNDLDTLCQISSDTFRETFAATNTAADMADYLSTNFSHAQLQAELQTPSSSFYLASDNTGALAYMKLNTGTAQTEPGHPNALEIQRIYVLQRAQGQRLGSQLMQTAITEARQQDLSYIWLGVWEHNTSAIRFYTNLGFTRFSSHTFILGTDHQTDHLLKLTL